MADLDLYSGCVHDSQLLTLPLAASLRHLAATHREVTAGSNSCCRIMASRRSRKLRDKTERWTFNLQAESGDRDEKSLLINQELNKQTSLFFFCSRHKAKNRQSFAVTNQLVGKFGGGGVPPKLSHFNQSRTEGIPRYFQQEQDEKIRLSQPAPLATKPPQARLLKENRCRVKSRQQLQKTSGGQKPTGC